MVAAGTVAAIFPDLDFVLGWISELTYLRGHRGVTHSLILLPLWGLLIAWLLARFWQRGGRVGGGLAQPSTRWCARRSSCTSSATSSPSSAP